MHTRSRHASVCHSTCRRSRRRRRSSRSRSSSKCLRRRLLPTNAWRVAPLLAQVPWTQRETGWRDQGQQCRLARRQQWSLNRRRLPLLTPFARKLRVRAVRFRPTGM